LAAPTPVPTGPKSKRRVSAGFFMRSSTEVAVRLTVWPEQAVERRQRIETVAPPEAIICAIGEASGNLYDESEFAVDCRNLRAVRVLRRYAFEMP
jgi:hypothetical protein